MAKSRKAPGHSKTAKDSLERRTEMAIFTLVAFQMLRGDNPKKKGQKHTSLHTVWTGFNEAFRQFFPDEDPVECQTQFAKEGLIVLSPFRKGALLRPTLDLLHSPTAEEIEVAKRVSAFIPGFIVQLKAKQEAFRLEKNAAATGKKAGKRSAKELKAHELVAAGDFDAAMKQLGYKA